MLCVLRVFFCLYLEQQKPFGTEFEACCSSWKGSYHQCDALGCQGEHLGRLSSSSKLAFERSGISMDFLVYLLVWTFHNSKARCPMFLFPIPLSFFTDVEFPLALLEPQATTLFWNCCLLCPSIQGEIQNFSFSPGEFKEKLKSPPPVFLACMTL